MGARTGAWVERVGPGVTGLRPGDRVVSDTGVTCGECKHCRAGDYQSCPKARPVGTIDDYWDGSFAEYMLMPERHLYKLPDAISLDDAALIEPASIALAGITRGGVAAGDTLLISGTGPIGLTMIPLARALGARRIIVSGRNSGKLERAGFMGADVVVNITKGDLGKVVRNETGGRGVDVALETSGNAEAVNPCLDAVRYKGNVALIGFYETVDKNILINDIVMKALHVVGIMGELGTPEHVIRLMVERGISFEPLITHRFSFGDILRAFDVALNESKSRIKVMVSFP